MEISLHFRSLGQLLINVYDGYGYVIITCQRIN